MPSSKRPINQKQKENDEFQDRLTRSIKRLATSFPDEWYTVLEYIENQGRQKKILDDIPDNIAARWAFAHSRIMRILLRLQLKNEND